MNEQVLHQAAIAYLVARTLEFMKNSKALPWIGHNTDDLNRNLSRLLALVSAAGFQWGWSGSLLEGGTLQIVVPAAENVLHFLYATIFQRAAQEGVYRIMIKPQQTSTPAPDPVIPFDPSAPILPSPSNVK